MSLQALYFSSSRLPRLLHSLSLIACLAGFAPALQAQTAHYNGAAAVNFGSVNVGASSAAPIALAFTFDTGGTLGSTAVVTQGAANLDFTDAGGGTCTANTVYSAGNTCTVKVTFKPRASGPRYGAAELLDTSGNQLAFGYVQGTGVAPQVVFADTTPGNYVSGKQSFLASGSIAPNCVAVDASGNLFITDGDAVKEIVAVNGSIPASPTIRTLATGFGWPYCVAVDGSGNLFVADRNADAAKEIVAVNGSIPASPTVRTLASGLGGPNGVAVDGSGNVFVADWENSTVKEIVAAGGYTTVKNLVPGSFACADYVNVDGSGNVYVADFCNGAAKEIMAAGGYTTVKTLKSGLSGVSSVAVDASGNLFVSLWGQGTAYEILAAGGYTTIHALSSGYTYLNSVAVDASGNVFIPDGAHNRVVKLDYADAPSLSFAPTAPDQTSTDSPQTVTVFNDGNADLKFSAVTYPADFPEASGVDTDCTASSVIAAGDTCTFSIDFTPQSSSLSGTSTLLSESSGLTTDSLNATTAQLLDVSGTVEVTAAAPVFSPPGGVYTSIQSVQIASTTPGAVIYYTLDGTTPTIGSSKYSVALTIAQTTTVKAVAVASGYGNSAASATYTINLPAAAAPVFTPAGGTYTSIQSVQISSTTPGANIYYTLDGSTPTTGSARYSTALTISQTTTIKAVAVASGYGNSPASATYTINLPAAAAPVFTPAGGTYTSIQSVQISSTTPGANIYYTLDGSTPTTGSARYSTALTVSKMTTVINAIALAYDYNNSAVSSAVYTIRPAAPTFSLPSGEYLTPQSLTISDTTPGATIYYTTNGSAPSASSTPYTGPIAINRNMTILATAVLSGYSDSPFTSGAYGIKAPAPTFSLPSGIYVGPQQVTISDSVSGAAIYYTTDGSRPTTSSTLYTGTITVSGKEKIIAVATAAGYANSPLVAAAYGIK